MKYRIELDDRAEEFRATRVFEFRDAVINAPADQPYRFLVDGRVVDRAGALAAADASVAAKWDRKLETHRRVRVSVGATALPNTFRSVWVRR